jgi:hypothetical protein
MEGAIFKALWIEDILIRKQISIVQHPYPIFSKSLAIKALPILAANFGVMGATRSAQSLYNVKN